MDLLAGADAPSREEPGHEEVVGDGNIWPRVVKRVAARSKILGGH